MATLKVIRKRITSVKNTQKITRAMKMVAAAKLRRAQIKLLAARPYGVHLLKILRNLASQIDIEKNPFFGKSETPNPLCLMVYTSDRGLCGGFNSNLLRRVQFYREFETKDYSQVDLISIGKKGKDFFRNKKIDFKEESGLISSTLTFEGALQEAKNLLQQYQAGEFSGLVLAYNAFKSAISQEIRIRKILPFDLGEEDPASSALPIIYEPSLEALFEDLLPRYVASEIYLAHLESAASELGARMSAMDNATGNAKEMIGKLTLQYNRLRQAAITTELMDIVNGAESLK